jgi:antitoxin ParD1/3/4
VRAPRHAHGLRLAKLAKNPILARVSGDVQCQPETRLSRSNKTCSSKTVKAGKYQNASEAVRDALRGLQLRHRQDELTLEALRIRVASGVAALERGGFTEGEEANLDAWLDDLAATDSGSKALKEAMQRVGTWPEEAQEQLAEIALEMDANLNGDKYHATSEELAGIDRGLKAAREGRFATSREVETVFAKHRRG